jgi:putative hydrolase of the HAD superfamily
MKTRLKGIIFDFGGVLSSHLPLEAQEQLCRIAGIDLEALKPDYIGFRQEYDRGAVSAAQYWQSVLGPHGVTPDEQMLGRLIEADVGGWTRINDEMISFIRSVRPGISRLGILSNMNVDCLHFIEENFLWLDMFDSRVFSCDVNLIKPEPPIYEYCLRSMGLAPNECLFLDDSQENTAAAAEAGIHSLHFKSVSFFRDELKEKYTME